jgi:replication factor C small subunit
MRMSKKLLTEEYRPKEVKDIIGLGKLNFKIDQELPHLLLYGSAGTGKTTLARIIIKELGCDFKELNASDERGIDTVRSQVNKFATTQSMDGKIKVIFLDEADALTPDAQNSLRNTMEKYVSNCRFILTCNDISKIIDPIQSRCSKIEFGNNIKPEDVVNRLVYICESEKIPFEKEALIKIADMCGNDVRQCINIVQQNKESGVTLDRLKIETRLASEIYAELEKGNFDIARSIYLEEKPDSKLLLKGLFDIAIESKENINVKRKCVHAIARGLNNIRFAAWPYIEVEDVFLYVIEALE